MPRLRAPEFNLPLTLESGQFFHWTREAGGFLVRHAGRRFRVRQDGGRLETDGDPAAVRRFFALDHDLPAVRARLRRDPLLRPAVDHAPGLRILRQDPWECTVAFLLSTASNIPRITRHVFDLGRRWGRHRTGTEAQLRALGVGFRAPSLVRAAALARRGWLDGVARLPTPEARERLMEAPGIAEKVADCILLFAFGRLEAFPVDTWIRRVMRERFFRGRRVPDRAIREFASERWGDLAGYAQQLLYVWSRHSGRASGRRPSVTRKVFSSVPRKIPISTRSPAK